MNIQQEIDQTRIDNIILGIKEPESLPKLISGDDSPEDINDVWLHKGKFGIWSQTSWDFTDQSKLIVYAGNQGEAEYWCRQQGYDLNCRNIRYLSDPKQLRGWRNGYLIRVGTWRKREKMSEILKFNISNSIELDGRDERDILMDLKALQAEKIQ